VTKVTAAVLHEYGGEFELGELELAQPADGQLRVRIVATGFCHTDEKVRLVQGDAVPRQFIPMLVERYRSGQLPLERLVSNYPLEQINLAAVAAHAGRCIKPVLTMRDS
jgi:Zn-dependent alcohol dehydrogenase